MERISIWFNKLKVLLKQAKLHSDDIALLSIGVVLLIIIIVSMFITTFRI